MKPYFMLACAVLLAGCHSTPGTTSQPTNKSSYTSSAPTEAPLLTTGQLRQSMLAYNLKTVRVKALIVDFGDGTVLQSCGQAATFGTKAVDANITSEIWSKSQNTSPGWIVANDLGSYFTTSSFSSTNSGHVLIQPAVPTVHYLDYVEIEGIYDANTNSIQATSAKTTGHYLKAH